MGSYLSALRGGGKATDEEKKDEKSEDAEVAANEVEEAKEVEEVKEAEENGAEVIVEHVVSLAEQEEHLNGHEAVNGHVLETIQLDADNDLPVVFESQDLELEEVEEEELLKLSKDEDETEEDETEQDHSKKIIDPERPFVCEYDGCSKTYLRRGDLERHTRGVHLNMYSKKTKRTPKRREAQEDATMNAYMDYNSQRIPMSTEVESSGGRKRRLSGSSAGSTRSSRSASSRSEQLAPPPPPPPQQAVNSDMDGLFFYYGRGSTGSSSTTAAASTTTTTTGSASKKQRLNQDPEQWVQY